jgi:hypothetical protein
MNLESITAEAYADDLTAIFKMSNGTVELILRILNNFTMVSGLEVNTDKTQLMIVGTENWPVGNQIGGITIVDKVKVLGVGIDRRLGQLDNNWHEAAIRMRRLSGYWCNFGMSITGRVMVAKTYLVSQVVYLMGVLPMSKEIGDIMNDILITFISGRNRPIERRRQLLGVECGGYGMMDMNIMNVCVKSTWIRRVKDMERDGLDYIGALIMKPGGVTYDQMGGDVDVGAVGIICKDILLKWFEYKCEYYMIGNNILEAYLFENKGVIDENDTVNNVVFNHGRYMGIRDNLREIRVRRMLDEQNRVRSKLEVEAVFNVGITWVEYFRIRTVLQQRVDARRDNGGAGKNVELLMSKGKIKSSKLRKKIVGLDSKVYLDNDPRTISALRTLWGGRIDEKERRYVELNLKTWITSVLDPEFKEFCFKLLHGRLYLNLALLHFSDTAPGCTFCTIKKRRDLRTRGIEIGSVQFEVEIAQVDGETTEHLMWGFREVNGVVKDYVNELAGTVGEEVSVIKYWEGCELEFNVDTMISIFVVRFIQYAVYRCRLRKRIPLLTTIREDVGFLLRQLAKRSKWQGGVQRIQLTCRQLLEQG